MNFNIKDFEGPLDLLLHLVKTSKMSIYDVDIKIIIDEYLDFIKELPNDNLDEASAYLVMASELIHLKSKILLNIDEDEKEDETYLINSEEDLKNKLIEYEQYKKVVDSFKTLEENRKDYYTKLPENISDLKEIKYINDDLTVDDLFGAMIELSKRMEYHKPLNTRITKKELSVEDKTKYIRTKIKKGVKTSLDKLFLSYSKDEIIVTFLSVLNMVKDNEIFIFQDSNFDKIYVEGK